MNFQAVIDLLGQPNKNHSFRLEGRDRKDHTAEPRTLYEWESADRLLAVEANAAGEVIEVDLRQKQGTTAGPFGILIGKDTVTSLVSKVGREYVETYKPRCQGDEVVVEFSLGCVPEGSTTLFFDISVSTSDRSGLDCGSEMALEQIVRRFGNRTIRVARLAY